MINNDDNDNIGIDEIVINHCLNQCRRCPRQQIQSMNIILDIPTVARHVARRLFDTKAPNYLWPINDFMDEWDLRMPGVGKHYRPTIEMLSGMALQVVMEDKNGMNMKGEGEVEERCNDGENITTMKTTVEKMDDSEGGNHGLEEDDDINSESNIVPQPSYHLKYFPEDKLSLDATTRFKQLFQERFRWRHDDLVPYLIRFDDNDDGVTIAITTPTPTPTPTPVIAALILEHTRIVTMDDGLVEKEGGGSSSSSIGKDGNSSNISESGSWYVSK